MKSKRILVILNALLLAGSLSGCATSTTQKLTPVNLVTDDANAQASQIKLAEAAVSVSQSLNKLAAIEQAVHPHAKLPTPPNPARIGMAQRTSIDWTGPIEPLIQRIAAASHYRVRILGTRPAIPVLVSISEKDIPLADILRDASFQGGKQTAVAVYPRSKVIELRYLSS